MREPTQAETVAAGPRDNDPQPKPPASEEYDWVDDCGDASFPASDPPGWWGGPSGLS